MLGLRDRSQDESAGTPSLLPIANHQLQATHRCLSRAHLTSSNGFFGGMFRLEVAIDPFQGQDQRPVLMMLTFFSNDVSWQKPVPCLYNKISARTKASSNLVSFVYPKPSASSRMAYHLTPLSNILSALSLLLTASFFLFTSANPTCTYLEIPIRATASNEVFPIPTDLDYTSPAAISSLLQTLIGDAVTTFPLKPTSFDGIVAARYCDPEVVVANRSDVIQLYMSGVTENNLYWFGLGYPDGIDGNMYSTVDFASKQGYPTLAIDRIGVGNSTHPDPITEQQVNLEEAVSHELVMALKAGTAVPGKSCSHNKDDV